MVVLIAGASHTGKTKLAQQLLEERGYPYLSIDHLKMGLIRSGMISLTPEDDEELTQCLWPIVREIVKTAVENCQNLTVEGAYIPPNWQDDFSPRYLPHIRYCCLIMSEDYILRHGPDILAYADVAERRVGSSQVDIRQLIADNRENLRLCRAFGTPYVLIDKDYPARISIPNLQEVL